MTSSGSRGVRAGRIHRSQADRRGTTTRRSARPRSPGASQGPTRPNKISVTETGEQEITDADLDPAVADGEGVVDRDARRGSQVSRRRIRQGRSRFDRSYLLARIEGLDAKRAIVLALVISVVALTLAMPVRTYFAQRAEFKQLSASNDRLQSEVTDYQQKVNEQSDPAYIEAKARERLQFVRPGEKALVMMFPGDDARIAEQKKAAERARSPWYGNLWESVSTPPNAK